MIGVVQQKPAFQCSKYKKLCYSKDVSDRDFYSQYLSCIQEIVSDICWFKVNLPVPRMFSNGLAFNNFKLTKTVSEKGIALLKIH